MKILLADKQDITRAGLIYVIEKMEGLESKYVEDKAELMPHLSWLQEQLPNAQIIPISAQHGHNLEALERVIADHLPEIGDEMLLAGIAQLIGDPRPVGIVLHPHALGRRQQPPPLYRWRWFRLLQIPVREDERADQSDRERPACRSRR